MKRSSSLRSQLILWVGGGIIVLLLGQLIGTISALEEREEESIDELLMEQMTYSIQLYSTAGRLLTPNVLNMKFYSTAADTPEGRIPLAFSQFDTGVHEVTINHAEYHFVVRDAYGKRFVLAYNVSQQEARIHEIIVMLLVSTLLVVIFALVGIFWLSGRILKHLSWLAHTVRHNGNSSLVQPGMANEVMTLAEALEDARAGQAILLEREREYSGYLSHELRTPLSIVRGEAEILILQYQGDELLNIRAKRIMQQADNMRAMIEQVLRLARGVKAMQRETIVLCDFIQQVWTDLELASQSRTQLVNHINEQLAIQADPFLLELILRNALSNARLHADGSLLTVSSDEAQLVIEDSNPVNTLFSWQEDRSAGLGLIILQKACVSLGWSCRIEGRNTGMRLTISGLTS